MKKLFFLMLVLGSTLMGSYVLYGSEYERPDNTNMTINNKTYMDFKNIGLSNGSWAIVLSDVRENKIGNSKNYYFDLKNLDKQSDWCVKAIDKSGNEYYSNVSISPGDSIIIQDIKKGKLITNKDSYTGNNVNNFNMTNLVSNWEYRIDGDKIISRFVCGYKHSTKVMGKDYKVKSSDLVLPNNSAEVSIEKGQKNLSWVEIVYN
ncbi:MAG: hypothetical protein Q4E02_05655 [Lagierella massiliensis]|nr:hypothetical protein [Lagierella massiliensis]